MLHAAALSALLATAAAAASESGSGVDSLTGNVGDVCDTIEDLYLPMSWGPNGDKGACRGMAVEDIKDILSENLDADEKWAHNIIFKCCNEFCPTLEAADLRTECMHGHAFHSATATFREKQTYRPSMQWNILFICLSARRAAPAPMISPLHSRLARAHF